MSLSNTEKAVKDMLCNPRRKFFADEQIRIVLDGLRGDGPAVTRALTPRTLKG